jgi:GntR family transcriptional regulator, transcriptional repressor for pyruvate dehydrogenase complex
MQLRTVARRSVCDDVYDQLAGNIMRGSPGAGEALLSERRLAEVLGVSRPVVREALRRLTDAGLVEVRQGGSTTVRDFRQHGGLNLLAELLMPDGHLDLPTARSLIEARHLIGPQVAALAAQRAGAALAKPLAQAISSIELEADPVARQWLSLGFWDLIVDGAGSIVFRLMYNGLRAAYEPLLGALSTVMDHDHHWFEAARALAAAITAQDAAAARSTAERLLSPSTTALMEAIDRMVVNP